MSLAFREEMERRFGSDDALNVTFVCSGPNERNGQVLTAAEMDALAEEQPHLLHEMDFLSEFPDGRSAVCCTNYAMQIFKALPGRVKIFGFANEDNPTARLVIEEFHPGGHDFAVVDDRYIVDPWPRLVVGSTEIPLVCDLQHEAAFATEWYGPQACWTRSSQAEKSATEF